MNTFILESEDFDFLMSEDCQMFMYEAAPKVKESFFKRAIAKIKAMLQKISDFITSESTKKRAEKLKSTIDKNPELAKQRVQIEDYESSYKLGESTLQKIEKAKTKEEVDTMTTEYQKRRKKRKKITITVAALVAIITGRSLYVKARNRMNVLDKEAKSALEAYNLCMDAINLIPDDFPDKSSNVDFFQKYANKSKKEYDQAIAKQKSASVIGFMAQDLRDMISVPFYILSKVQLNK